MRGTHRGVNPRLMLHSDMPLRQELTGLVYLRDMRRRAVTRMLHTPATTRTYLVACTLPDCLLHQAASTVHDRVKRASACRSVAGGLYCNTIGVYSNSNYSTMGAADTVPYSYFPTGAIVFGQIKWTNDKLW